MVWGGKEKLATAVSCVYERGYEMLSWKQNARGLASKNVRWDDRDESMSLQDLYSRQICSLVSRVRLLHEHDLGKKCCWCSPVGAWLVIMRVALAHREGLAMCPHCQWAPGNDVLSWKYIFHWLTSESHSSLRQNSYDILHGKTQAEMGLVSTFLWGGHPLLLGQSQNVMRQLGWHETKDLMSFRMTIEWW